MITMYVFAPIFCFLLGTGTMWLVFEHADKWLIPLWLKDFLAIGSILFGMVVMPITGALLFAVAAAKLGAFQ